LVKGIFIFLFLPYFISDFSVGNSEILLQSFNFFIQLSSRNLNIFLDFLKICILDGIFAASLKHLLYFK
jgi:hypothetical protein